ncbi:hypothetical protein RJ55_04494 [Drechmeria coniospora]|nr:hypothetical protein RJ55_04494 [Drechmeria coniospora]
MFFATRAAVAASAAVAVSALCTPLRPELGISVTPHEQYSSSIGALGCKLDTNRVAYWPEPVDCDNICVKVTHGDRSLHLLKVDQSTGAHDISYDAWNTLVFGEGAESKPHTGGGVAMTYRTVPADECKHLFAGGKLSLSAANSMNYVALCQSQPDSWVAKNLALVNILDPQCKYGHDEVCTLDMQTSNQAKCPHQLGAADPLNSSVVNLQYGTGKQVPS